MKPTLLLALAAAALAQSNGMSDWTGRAGDPYTQEQLEAFLSAPKLPTGAKVTDKANSFASVMAMFSGPMTNAHTGFSLALYEPKAWLGAKAATAKRRFQSLGAAELPREDRLPVLRVLVHPDTPVYLTAMGASAASSADHVVIRSIDKRIVAQPLWIGPTSEEIWNGLGARVSYGGLSAVFAMADLERIRASSSLREFLVSVIGEWKGSSKDFRIKPKFFRDLGD